MEITPVAHLYMLYTWVPWSWLNISSLFTKSLNYWTDSTCLDTRDWVSSCQLHVSPILAFDIRLYLLHEVVVSNSSHFRRLYSHRQFICHCSLYFYWWVSIIWQQTNIGPQAFAAKTIDLLCFSGPHTYTWSNPSIARYLEMSDVEFAKSLIFFFVLI